MDRTNRNEDTTGCIESHHNPPSPVVDPTHLFGAYIGHPPTFKQGDRIDPRIGMANRVLWRCVVNEETGCWEWQDATNEKGYGRVKFGGRILLPHRIVAVAAGILTGPSEDDDPHLVLHECDNGRCCNPAHMKAGDQSQNMKDCVARGRWRNQHPNIPRPAPCRHRERGLGEKDGQSQKSHN